MNKHSTLFILWSLFSIFSGAQERTIDVRVERIGTREGLPESSVQVIFEDHLGFLWLGTQSGLVRYDGYQMDVFNFAPADTNFHTDLIKLNVWAIDEDPTGDLWVGTEMLQPFGENWAGSRRDHPVAPLLYRFDRERETLIPYLYDPRDSVQVLKHSIRAIYAASAHDIWVGTGRGGLYRLRPERDYLSWEETADIPVRHYSYQNGYFPDEHNDFIRTMAEDTLRGNFWIATLSGLLERIPGADSFRLHLSPAWVYDSGGEMLTGLHLAKTGDLWLGCGGTWLSKYDPEEKTFEYFSPETNGIWNVYGVYQQKPDRLWAGYFTREGMLIWWNPVTQEGFQVNPQIINQNHESVSDLKIRSIQPDRAGNIWIGTHRNGLYKFNDIQNEFHWKEQLDPKTKLRALTEVAEDAQGNLWVSTAEQGLFRWDRKSDQWQNFQQQTDRANGMIDNNISGISIDQAGRIWYGGEKGVGFYDPKTHRVQRMANLPGSRDLSLFTDSKNNLWVTYQSGIEFLDRSSDTLRHYLRGPIKEVFEDSDGIFWIGTFEVRGFYRFDPRTEQFRWFDYSTGNAFLEDQKGNLWVGTHNDGLLKIDRQSLTIEKYDSSDGLPHDNVQSILEDGRGRLWLMTGKGLARFYPERKAFRTFHVSDGLPEVDFTRPGLKGSDGTFYFPAQEGLLYFHPDSIKDNPVPPRIAFTGLDLLGEPVPVEENGPLRTHPSVTRRIRLEHWQNDLTLHYVALHYKNPERNRYQVYLENYDSGWRDVGSQRFANYTNLDPGHYTFWVKAANSDGKWNEEAIMLDIVIRSPWYWNGWSQTLYLILLLGIAFSFYRFQLNRRLALAEANRLQELDQVKSQLYTNVTHEFRTPLTIMQGLTDELRKDFKGRAAEKLGLIRRNGEHLLRLVNQLLDITRLETGQVRLQPVQANVAPFLGYLTESFYSWAERKHIRLSFFSDEDEVFMDYDPERLQQVVSNLLSNALKFTPAYGKVAVGVRRLAPDRLEIKVKDNGPGIAEVHLPRIFDRFYQVDATSTRKGEGTGIGLALTRELVGLMGGTVTVDSTVGKGTTFTVTLPITRKAPLEQEPNGGMAEMNFPPIPVTNPDQPAAASGKLPLLLIIEDNADVRYYLRTCLAGTHRIEEANNGKEGLDKALELVPDVIISDVMMPELDGFELCEQLKGDPRTSHIPLILLTARATAEDRLQGLRTGADAYLAKPFSREELEVRLAQLVELRRKLRERFSNGWPGLADLPQEDPEAAFMKKLNEIIAKNLSEEDFGVKELSRALTMSRMQLHRKLTALTGLSTSDYLKQARLHHARELLRKTDLRVGEVAARVGFKGHSHFSRAYRALFGEAPSEGRL